MKTQLKVELKQEEELREFQEQAEVEIGGLKAAVQNFHGETEELRLLAQKSKRMLREKTEWLKETEKLQELRATVKEQKHPKSSCSGTPEDTAVAGWVQEASSMLMGVIQARMTP